MKNLWLVLPLLLAACGPQMRTNYQLFPPKTESGRLCANNCLLMSNTCVTNCRAMARQCASVDYDSGLGIGAGSGWGYRGGFVGAGFSRPLSGAECSSRSCEESCLAAARQCHTNCGGTVTSQTVCVANCPKPQPLILPQQ